MGDEARQPEGEGPDRDQAAGPVGELDAPERFFHQERHQEEKRAENYRIGGSENADERVRRQYRIKLGREV